MLDTANTYANDATPMLPDSLPDSPATMTPTQAIPIQEQPAQRRPGAQPGDRRAFRHGLRGTGMGKKCRKEESQLNAVRRNIEDVVIEAKGEISFMDACAINTAMRHERHSVLAARWLRLHGESMTHAERLSYSAAIATASTQRDRALAAIQLPRRGDEQTITLRPTGGAA